MPRLLDHSQKMKLAAWRMNPQRAQNDPDPSSPPVRYHPTGKSRSFPRCDRTSPLHHADARSGEARTTPDSPVLSLSRLHRASVHSMRDAGYRWRPNGNFPGCYRTRPRPGLTAVGRLNAVSHSTTAGILAG